MHELIMRVILLLLVLFSTCLNLRAQYPSESDTTPFYLMSLEQLMNVNVTVASQLPMTNRESPGIVTTLNRVEIINSGASDLMGLLQMVPGFDFGVDVEGVIGIGVRGNWAHEGKVLLIVDEMEMNEDLYSTLQFGAHYPIDQIKKIEIIRGPGSAMYGGNAEYAVINITTINSKDFDGINVSTQGSLMSETFASRGLSLAAGHNFGRAHVNFSTVLKNANRSQDVFHDASGNSYDMTDQSGLSNNQYRLDLNVGSFSATGMIDNYSIEQRDGYRNVYSRPYVIDFSNAYITAKYDYQINEKLKITPGYKHKNQHPWTNTESDISDDFTPYSTRVCKNEYYLTGNYDPTNNINVIGGMVYYNQDAEQGIDSLYFSNSTKLIVVDNYAGFVQGIFKLKPLNIILGSRYEYNSSYDPSFVPRIGVTKVFDNFHFKGLYSRAFRAPSIENIDITPDILPERTSVVEFEGGMKLSPNCYLTANLFDITTNDPIIFDYDENEEETYINETSTGSRGFDIDVKAKLNGWYATVSYSYNTTAGHNIIQSYRVPGVDNKVLAFPSHMLNANCNIQLSRRISVSPTFNFLSERYSYLETTDGSVLSERIAPVVYSNINLTVTDVFCKGLMFQAGCFNLTDEKSNYIQPYNGNHRPLPGQGRQFQLRLNYTLSFERN